MKEEKSDLYVDESTCRQAEGRDVSEWDSRLESGVNNCLDQEKVSCLCIG